MKKFFFDMDGVLVDFSLGVKELLNIEPIPQGTKKKPKDYDDILFTKIKEHKNFYRELKEIPEGIELFKYVVEKIGIENVEVLTGVPKPTRNIPEAPQNKIDWCKEHLPYPVKINPVLRKDKPLFITGKDSILIDDYNSNIKEWVKAGGTGFLFNPSSTPDEVKNFLE